MRDDEGLILRSSLIGHILLTGQDNSLMQPVSFPLMSSISAILGTGSCAFVLVVPVSHYNIAIRDHSVIPAVFDSSNNVAG